MQEDKTKIVLSRYVKRMREDAIDKQQETMLLAVNSKSLAQIGWTLDKGMQIPYVWTDPDSDEQETRLVKWKQVDSDRPSFHKYEMYFTLCWRQIRTDLVKSEDHGPAMILHLSTVSSVRENGQWTLETVDGEEWEPPEEDPNVWAATGKQYLGYTEVVIPDDFESYFSHLFGLDAQIAVLKSAIEAGIQSGWEKRFGVKLIGPPGCGKTAVVNAMKAALGEDVFMQFDATSTTAAGALKNIASRDILPRILAVEEIEKTDQESMKWCLAALDQRAEIRKHTYRDQIEMETKLFGICTVNDEDKFNAMHSGALADRFEHPIYFSYPSRDLLWKILERETLAYPGGDFAWIDPCLDFCEEYQITHPRRIIAICISGGSKWVTGEYQKVLRATMKHPPKDYSTVAFEDLDFEELAG